MSAQAQHLQELVGFFNVGKGASAPAAAAKVRKSAGNAVTQRAAGEPREAADPQFVRF